MSVDLESEEAMLSFHVADNMYYEWTKKFPSRPEPLEFIIFDEDHSENSDSESDDDDDEEKKSRKQFWEDESASENESIPDFDPDSSDDEDLAISSKKHHGDEDDDSDDEEDLMWPGFLDRVIYRFSQDFQLTACLMNKPERKVYSAFWKERDVPVVIVVAENLDGKRTVRGVPREVRVMKQLRGLDGVADIYGWCPVDDEHYAILMPYYMNCDLNVCCHGNLYAAAKITKSILQGVANIHERKVVHRDLAKYNVMWDPVKEQAVVIDFDTSCFYRPQGYFRNVGRDRYDAPEKAELLAYRKKLWDSSRKKPKVKKKFPAYTEKADVYSVGVMLWMMLGGHDHAPSPYKLKRWIKKRKEKRKHHKHPELDLLFKLLNADPRRRLTAQEALNHPFLKIVDDNPPTEENDNFYDDYTEHQQVQKFFLKMVASDSETESDGSDFDDDEESDSDSLSLSSDEDDDNYEEKKERKSDDDDQGDNTDGIQIREIEESEESSDEEPQPQNNDKNLKDVIVKKEDAASKMKAAAPVHRPPELNPPEI